ncbi:MAG: Na/Pi cotransporter family protein [Salinarimonas sp.]
MTVSALMGLLGGIGLFLLGMGAMTNGLRQGAGSSLRGILARSTATRLRGLAAGFSITAIAQSSTAVTIATIGFVNAGLLNLPQAVWVVFGANLGTTSTSWLISLIGVNVRIDMLALPAIGIGALLRLVARENRAGSFGEALAGFGLFFLGIVILKDTFGTIAETIDMSRFIIPGFAGTLIFVGIGFIITQLTQSSSASIAIAITAASGGLFGLETAAALVIGANLGTTSTALLATIGATAAARRVALAHVIFNLIVATIAIIALPLLIAFATALSDWTGAELDGARIGGIDVAAAIAIFHTLVKAIGILVVWPIATPLVGWLETRFRSGDEDLARPKHLDPTTSAVPDLALGSIALEIRRLGAVSSDAARVMLAEAGDPRDRARAQGRFEAADRLIGAIRDFIARLRLSGMAPHLANGLTHALRALQHYQNLASLATQARPTDLSRPGLPQAIREALAAYRDNVVATLSPPAPDEPDSGTGSAQADAERVESAYQQMKSTLLVSAAQGTIDPMTLDRLVTAIDRLRRCGEHAAKARRRLTLIEKSLNDGRAADTMQETRDTLTV